MCGNTGTTVLAHRNIPGTFGIGIKSEDHEGAYLCNSNSRLAIVSDWKAGEGCHQYGDANKRDYQFWEKATRLTRAIWFRNGWLKVEVVK